MSTTLLVAEQALSKDIGDYWASTTTEAGSATTLVDTAFKAKANDWITDETYVMLTEEPASAAAIYDERKASSLDNSTGTLTTLAFAAAPGTGIDYEVHRLFSPSEKRRALIAAARRIYPQCFTEIWDETLVSGNWLKDGSFEIWTSSSALTNWTTSASTITQTSTANYFEHGAYSCKIDTATGYISQSVSNFDDIKRLAGKTVKFSVRGHCDTADCLRLSIYDGTTTTYSDYHPATSDWTAQNDPLEVEATIATTPTEITFKVLHAVAAGTSYVDDARAISGRQNRVYIGNLGLVQNRPHQVFMEPSSYSQEEEWVKLVDWAVDPDGYLHLPTTYPRSYRLRIKGLKMLDFLASGTSSTAWTATIDIEQPQLEILVAQAALYLYTWMAVPNQESGTTEDYKEMMGYWKDELNTRKALYRMQAPAATIHFGVH